MSDPAGGGRAAPPSLLGAWLGLALGVGAAVLAVSLDRLRLGAYLLAATLAVVALARLVLPERWMGAVAARGRGVDVVVLAGTAVAALVLARTLRLTA